jgi:hypothetical protein
MAENPDRIHYSGSYGPESVADPAFPYDREKVNCWTIASTV